MDEDTKRKLLEIGNEVRAWAEHLQKQTMNLFGKNLMGLCGIASAYLFCKLKATGIKTTIISNEKHCFVLTNDDYVIDVTATQFGFEEKVLFIKREEALYRSPFSICYTIKEQHNSVDSLRLWQIREGWPAHQMAASQFPNENELA